MSEMQRAQSHRHSASMTEIHQASAPPTPKPVTPVPVHAYMAPPTPPASNFGYPPPPPSAAGGYPPPPVSVAPPPPHQYIPPPHQYIPPPSPSVMPASPLPSYRDLSPPRVPTPPEESRVELIKVEEEHWPPHSHSRSHSRSHSHGRSSPSASHVSRRKSRRGSITSGRDRERSDREEIYIQRDRIIERGTPSPHPPPSPSSFARRGSRSSRGSGTPEPVLSGYRTVEGTGWDRDRDHVDRRPITPSGYRVVEGQGGRRGSGVGVGSVHREREWEREKGSMSGSGSDFGGRRGSVTFENGPRGLGRFVERERERDKVVMDEGGRRREFYRRG
ncbi:predicted protein [Sclerotinia sclerotiorum 1980 UF-70]|nr:predicted protein [Sclerotinia sclerotiorum 1980 UF-70]EDN97952.1 predicted protein [Sclerotinia sclerotiorum 1980 UF-70]